MFGFFYENLVLYTTDLVITNLFPIGIYITKKLINLSYNPAYNITDFFFFFLLLFIKLLCIALYKFKGRKIYSIYLEELGPYEKMLSFPYQGSFLF